MHKRAKIFFIRENMACSRITNCT